MKAKTLGIVGAVGSVIIGAAAYGFYSSGRPTSAVILGAIALIWVVLAVNNFRVARGQSGGY